MITPTQIERDIYEIWRTAKFLSKNEAHKVITDEMKITLLDAINSIVSIIDIYDQNSEEWPK